MKKLDLSAVSATNQFPVKEGTLDFINLAYQEALTAIGNNILGVKADPTYGYVLWGCVNSTTAPTFTISAGAIYYNGEQLQYSDGARRHTRHLASLLQNRAAR